MYERLGTHRARGDTRCIISSRVCPDAVKRQHSAGRFSSSFVFTNGVSSTDFAVAPSSTVRVFDNTVDATVCRVPDPAAPPDPLVYLHAIVPHVVLCNYPLAPSETNDGNFQPRSSNVYDATSATRLRVTSLCPFEYNNSLLFGCASRRKCISPLVLARTQHRHYGCTRCFRKPVAPRIISMYHHGIRMYINEHSSIRRNFTLSDTRTTL